MGVSRFDPMVLAASEARTADGNGDPVVLFTDPESRRNVRGVALVCDVTNADTDAGDTLDVFVQTQLDGTNWVDVAHFTQVIGTDAAKRFFAKLVPALAEAMFENATTLGAGSIRHLIGERFRARWVIVDSGDADQTFTFSVTAIPE